MAVDFSYANTITAGNPIVAAEVQGNFDDLLAHIESYYQQTADTTAEIAAAIAAAPSMSVVALKTATGNVAWTTVDTKNQIPGLTATWTASATHVYKIEVASVYWTDSGGSQSHRHFIWAGNGSTYNIVYGHTGTATNTGATAPFEVSGGSTFLTGLSGEVTWNVYIGSTDGSSCNANAFTSGMAQMVVVDMGVAP